MLWLLEFCDIELQGQLLLYSVVGSRLLSIFEILRAIYSLWPSVQNIFLFKTTIITINKITSIYILQTLNSQ